MASELVLNGAANQLQKTVLFFVLTQLLLKLRCKQVEQFSITCGEWLRRIYGAENNHIAWCANDDLAAEATLDVADIGTLLDVLDSERI